MSLVTYACCVELQRPTNLPPKTCYALVALCYGLIPDTVCCMKRYWVLELSCRLNRGPCAPASGADGLI